MRDLAQMIAAEVGFTGDIVWDSAKLNGQTRRCLDVSRAKQLFGFHAAHRLREGIAQTVAWFQAHRHSLREVTFACNLKACKCSSFLLQNSFAWHAFCNPV